MAITTYDGLLETWAEQTETMEQNLENLYGPSTITPVLPSVTTEDGMLEAAAEQTELAAWNFAKMYSYLSTETNTTRIVDVPDTALYYCQLAMIGGQTVAESGELLSAEVTNVISRTHNGNTLQTYPIPDEVRGLEGYGWSAGTVYNYIDFERKVFVQNVARVDLGTLTWTKNDSAYSYVFYSSNSVDTKKGGSKNLIVPGYTTASYRGVMNNDKMISPYNANSSKQLAIRDDSYADAASLTSALDGVYAYFELATPVEIDISAYITDTDIKVEAGGTLTFENDNELDVPSEVKYIS